MEIFLVVVIVLGIIMLPKMLGKRPAMMIQRPHQDLKITGWIRLALVASFLWPVLVALYFKPWDNQWYIFLYVAIGPVALAWGISWVISGFRKKGKYGFGRRP